MTIHEVTEQLHKLTGGRLNGEQFTVRRLTDYLFERLSTGRNDRVVMIATLPDGNWHILVMRWGSFRDGYDYDIPDTREDEKKIIALLDN